MDDTGTGGTPGAAAAGAPAQTCVGFSQINPGTQMPSNFPLGPFLFEEQGGGADLIVLSQNGLTALRFPPAGVKVTLPRPAISVAFEIGTFAGEVEVEAYDTRGNLVFAFVVPGTNQFLNFRFGVPGTESILFKQGGNEGMLAKICFTPQS